MLNKRVEVGEVFVVVFKEESGGVGDGFNGEKDDGNNEKGDEC